MKYPADIVKQQIASDLHERKLTQKDIAEMMGITRQTVASVLSSNQYFSSKHATLFSLALGYDKDYLMSGEGSLISGKSERGKLWTIEVQNKLISILLRIVNVSKTVQEIVLHQGRDVELLEKTLALQNLYYTLQCALHLDINEKEKSAINPELMDSALKIFDPSYNELKLFIKDHYDIDLDEG